MRFSWPFLYSMGVMPITGRKTRLKLLWLLNPASSQMQTSITCIHAESSGMFSVIPGAFSRSRAPFQNIQHFREVMQMFRIGYVMRYSNLKIPFSLFIKWFHFHSFFII